MPSHPAVGPGGGATTVLGVKAVKGLAATGLGIAKVIWSAVAGAASIASGAAMLGRGRSLSAGEPIDER